MLFKIWFSVSEKKLKKIYLNKNLAQICSLFLEKNYFKTLTLRDGVYNFLKINVIELIIIDIVPCDQEPMFDFSDSSLKQVYFKTLFWIVWIKCKLKVNF